MNKIFTILIVIGLAFMIGCIGEETITISKLNEDLINKTVVLEGTMSYEREGQIPFNGCYLTDDTGGIMLKGDKILVREIYPPQCEYENKVVRITGIYKSIITYDENGIRREVEGAVTSSILVEKIEVLGENKQELTKEQECINAGGNVSTVDCCNCKDFQELATPNFLCFQEEMIETKTCACPEKTAWNGTACRDYYNEMTEKAKTECLDYGGQIVVSQSVGGTPSAFETCDCGENSHWNYENSVCINELI